MHSRPIHHFLSTWYHNRMESPSRTKMVAPPPTVSLTDTTIWRSVIFLAWPALAQQGLLLSIQLYDQYLTGQFSPEHQAALTTANYLYWFVSSYAVVITAGATALVARFVGAGDFALARRAAGQSLLLATGLGIITALIGLAGLHTLVHLLRLGDAVAEHAVAYLTPLAMLLPFYLIEVTGIACLIGAGDTRTGLKVLATVVLVNIPLASVLSTGWGGLPNLSFVGIAWGTGISHVVGCLLVLFTLIRGRYGLVLDREALFPDGSMIYRLLRVSIPAAADSLSVGVFQFVFLAMVNDLGPTAASAHGIAIRLEGLGYLSGAAFAVAASSLVGRSLGAHRPDLAARCGWSALAMGAGLMTVMGAIFFLAARPMFHLFCPLPSQADVIATGVPVLRLVAFAMPGLSACIILTQALRGAGDTRYPVIITWAGFLGVRLPLTYLLTHSPYQFGLIGAWIAMFADIYLRGFLFVLRFAGGVWKTVRV
ncbi:MAG: MATE family efflux transporter [Bacteroidales bacterium]|nr:MATE family efflux transporter [Bacteroidales bacterium]